MVHIAHTNSSTIPAILARMSDAESPHSDETFTDVLMGMLNEEALTWFTHLTLQQVCDYVSNDYEFPVHPDFTRAMNQLCAEWFAEDDLGDCSGIEGSVPNQEV